MIGRIVLAALLAGIAAGIILAGIQHVRLTPLILAAEVYEKAADAAQEAAAAKTATEAPAKCVENMPGHIMCNGDAKEWEPADGIERTLYTTAASMLAGAGFAAMLAGVSLLIGIPITPRNGLVWGLCGFLAFTIAPGAGLPPELPGMPAGDLMARQIWWVGTIAATGVGLYLIAVRRELVWIALAVVLIALPHMIGAPQPPTEETTVPAGLAAAFASNTVAAAAVFWSLIGVFLGLALQKFNGKVYAP
jgi:cobalt transporter subunit CbtA